MVRANAKWVTTETPAERFHRLAYPRRDKVLEALRILSNCGERPAYEYTDAEVNAIFKEIEEAMRIAKGQFRPNRARIRA